MDITDQESAIKALKEFGSVLRDNSLPSKPVVEIDLGRSSVSDDDIVGHLRCIPTFERLYLDQTNVTDSILQLLQDHPELRKLILNETQITDAGLEYLKFAKNIEDLTLGEKITDSGLVHLKKLTGLRSLRIAETAVTDKGLAKFDCLENLEFLGLSSKQVSRASIAYLVMLPKLKTIGLRYVDSLDHPSVILLKQHLPRVQIEC